MGLKPRKKSSATKTRPTKASVASFIDGLADERRRNECKTLVDMMSELSGEPPVMWGSIVGFGNYRYKYASGREGDWPRTGFAPRKASLTIYCMPGFADKKDLLSKLGEHKTSVSCLYIKKLEDVDLGVLRDIIDQDLAEMSKRYPLSGASA